MYGLEDTRQDTLRQLGVPDRFIAAMAARRPPGFLSQRLPFVFALLMLPLFFVLVLRLPAFVHWTQHRLYDGVPAGDLFGVGKSLFLLVAAVFVVPGVGAVFLATLLKLWLDAVIVQPSPAYHAVAWALVRAKPGNPAQRRQNAYYQGLAGLPDEQSFVRTLAARWFRQCAGLFLGVMIVLAALPVVAWYVAGQDYWVVTGDDIAVHDLAGAHLYALKDAVAAKPYCELYISRRSRTRHYLFHYNLVLKDRTVDLWEPDDPHRPFDRNVTYATLDRIDRRLQYLGVPVQRMPETQGQEDCLANTRVAGDSDASLAIVHRMVFGAPAPW